MARILAVGIATLDIINIVPCYPAEDSEVRALDQRLARGGNATNTLVVLSQLGHGCSWGGVLAADSDAVHILADLDAHGIDRRYCRREAHGKNPTSYILLSQATASRSIVHYRDLPEFSAADFAHVPLGDFDWLHFEGRNPEETERMLVQARQTVPATPISVEIEKPRPDIERLYAYADLLLFSRVFAQSQGYSDPGGFLAAIRAGAPQAELVCSWGVEGAMSIDRDGRISASPAFPPPQVIDTLGAGDTFNAGVIDGCLRGLTLAQAIENACRLAGRKCGQTGFASLGEAHV